MSKKNIVITGAASGIGLATARLFHHKGYAVAVLDLPEALARVQATEPWLQQTLCIPTDVAAGEQVAAAFSTLRAKLGPLHFAVNNAGINGGATFFSQTPSAELEKVMAVNFFGVANCLREELLAMGPEGGAIVNLASVMGLVGAPRSAAYCASKHAVVGLTRAVALEWANRNVRINAICPGAVDTPLLQAVVNADEKAMKLALALHPMRRFASPDEMARSIEWLLSDACSFMTGQAVPVDGGYTTG